MLCWQPPCSKVPAVACAVALLHATLHDAKSDQRPL